MPYQIEWKPSALKEFRRLPADIRAKVENAVGELADNPRPAGCRKIVGLECAYRIRVGTYRLIYEIQDNKLLVHVVRVRHRRDAYRGV